MQKHAPRPDDQYARGSFTFREMKSWQVWGITVVAVLILLALLAWSV